MISFIRFGLQCCDSKYYYASSSDRSYCLEINGALTAQLHLDVILVRYQVASHKSTATIYVFRDHA